VWDVWSFNFVNILRFYYQISTKWSILLIIWINNINIIRLKKLQKFIINILLISFIKNLKFVNCTLTKVLLHWKKNAQKNLSIQNTATQEKKTSSKLLFSFSIQNETRENLQYIHSTWAKKKIILKYILSSSCWLS
jgi:hypothetical protein